MTNGITALWAGTGDAVITPPVGLWLLGPLSPSTAVHDDLHARVLALRDAAESVVIVSLDLIGLEFEMSERIAEAVRQSSGIDNVLIHCIHTHSSPFTIPWSWLGWQECKEEGSGWLESLPGLVVDAAEQAVSQMRRVSARYGRSEVRIGANRREEKDGTIVLGVNPEGPEAAWVDALTLDGVDGSSATILSHAAHAVAVHSASTEIGADYPGYAVVELARLLGKRATAMFAQGCCGNVNVDDVNGGHPSARKAGLALGKAAAEAVKTSRKVSGGLRFASVSTNLRLAPLPSADECMSQIVAARETLDKARETETHPRELWALEDAVACLEDRLRIVTTMGRDLRIPTPTARGVAIRRSPPINETPAEGLRFDVAAVAIGREFCLTAMTHEVFVDYQLWVEQNSPYPRNMVLAYSGACESYVPTAAELARPGYETAWDGAALRYKYRRPIAPDAEAVIYDALREVWRKLDGD